MSCNDPTRPALFSERTAGLTIIELLIASALGLVVTGVLLNLLVTTGGVKVRNDLQLSVDDSMRASLELMAMDLREAVGPRIVISSSSLPSGLGAYASSSSSFTVTNMPQSGILRVDAPPNYSSSNPSYSNSANTQIIDPTGRCASIFQGGEYAIVTTTTQSSWIKVADNNPCAGSNGANPKVLHPGYQLSYPYDPSAVIGKVTAMQYRVQMVDGVSSLTRQIAGDNAQVVAQNITGLSVEYSSDGATFSSSPVKPVAVRLTLTGQRTQGSRTSTLTLSNTVFMRDTTVPAPVGEP